MLQRSPLSIGENSAIHVAGEILVAKDHASASAPQSLVSSRGDQLGMAHRRRVLPCGDQTGDVSNIRHENRVHFVGDLAEPVELDGARVRGRAADDDLRTVLLGKTP